MRRVMPIYWMCGFLWAGYSFLILQLHLPVFLRMKRHSEQMQSFCRQKRGRIALCVSKVLAGITVALIQALILVGGLFTVMFVFFGKGGAQGMIQNMIPSSPWNITIGRMTGLYVLLAIVTTIMFALTNMLVSYLTHSAVATMAGHAAVLFVGLFNVPSKLGILAKLWQLRPTMALHYGTFCNTYRYGKMNNVEAALLIYGMCIAISVVILILSYRKSQIESR